MLSLLLFEMELELAACRLCQMLFLYLDRMIDDLMDPLIRNAGLSFPMPRQGEARWLGGS